MPHAEDLEIPTISLLLAAVLCLYGWMGENIAHAQPPGSSSASAGKVYHEAPELARLTAEGRLPPVASRLPDDPMVVPVYEEIGRYGGTWHRLMRGTSDIHAFTRITYENILRWSSDAKEIIPNLANRWEWMGDDFRCLRVHLRKGLRWSDGRPSPPTTSFFGGKR